MFPYNGCPTERIWDLRLHFAIEIFFLVQEGECSAVLLELSNRSSRPRERDRLDYLVTVSRFTHYAFLSLVCPNHLILQRVLRKRESLYENLQYGNSNLTF